MARKRRNFEIFSMSFLDCMCCGFGAVVLVFMIINAQVLHRRDAPREDRTGETARLEVEILEQRKNMVLAKNSMEQLEGREDQCRGADRADHCPDRKIEGGTARSSTTTTLAKIESVEKLQSDIKRLEDEKKRLLPSRPSGNRRAVRYVVLPATETGST